VGLDIPWSYLYGSSYIDVDVVARFVQPGGTQGAVGLDGDAVGFALAVKGVQRDSTGFDDDDGDGVFNTFDACPDDFAHPQFDQDRDGCLDDGDNDGVPSPDDLCPYETALPQFDSDRDGCVDDEDGDGVLDNNDLCPEEAWEYMDDNRDGCDDANQWFIMIAPTDVCYSETRYGISCSMWIQSIEVTIDERTIHQESGSILVLSSSVGATDRSWVYVFDKTQDASIENATKIELELEILFWHSSMQTTQGRQFGSWPGNWDPFPSYTPPIVYWNYDVEFQKGMLRENMEDERIISVSNRQYSPTASYQTHTFGWLHESTTDVDGDGFTVPGVSYDGPCPMYYCNVNFRNVEDAFPNDATQWSDRDGDGYGDNASGYLADLFPDDPSEWADEDGDGYGSNSDVCPDEYGTSTMFYVFGCPDSDGDGYADQGYDVCPEMFGTARFHGTWGCPDSDMDGYADPVSTGAWAEAPIDRCPNEYGTASRGDFIGCQDRDRDGWADVEDDLPDDGSYWTDSDGDGVADEEDVFANNRFLSDENDVVGLIFFAGLIMCLALLVVSSKRRARDDVLSAELTIWLDQFRVAPSNYEKYEMDSAETFEKNDLR
jgi:hypothetical protein